MPSLLLTSTVGCTSIKKEMYCKISDADIEKLQYSNYIIKNKKPTNMSAFLLGIKLIFRKNKLRPL
jgi:hypothetical protein